MKMFFAFYFWFISKNWITMGYLALITAIISLVLTYYILPESPRFLYEKNRIKEAK
jgi:hypothetical protein